MQETLNLTPALQRPYLLSPTVFNLLHHWHGTTSANEVLVTEIDPRFAGGNDFCSKYGLPITQGANCVIIEATRGEKRTLAACVALVNSRMDLNGVIRKALDARRVSLAPLAEILNLTQMEYGSITPFGLPTTWPILIDEEVVKTSRIIIGAGMLRAKLSLPVQMLIELPLATVLTGLGVAL